VLFRNYQTGSE